MPVVGSDIDSPYALTAEAIARFRADGFVKLKDVFTPETLAHYGARLAELMVERARTLPPLEQRDTYGKAFQEALNLWTADAVAREFCFSKRLARIAAELMGCAGVRLYHDQALYKEPGGGITPWHADQAYWPFASDRACVAWVPFQAVPLEMGPLAFSVASHRADFGRKMLITDESERVIARTLKDLPMDEGPFALGEISFHSGWTFHRAGGNRTGRMRQVFTIKYMDAGMRLADREEAERKSRCWHEFSPGVQPGEPLATHLNPLLYAGTASSKGTA
jgi:ectoine hydroxylase-related dioxygenase (phytanoyl-CoA dioxygenase family)